MWIYKITNKLNGKAYIGQTRSGDVKDRWKVHKSAHSGGGRNAIKRAIQKYGVENFEFETLCKADSEAQLNEFEKKYIAELNTLAPNGYNLMTGGAAPRHSEETKKKLSQIQIGRIPWNKGLTKEDPRVASYIRYGKEASAYGKARHSVPHSEETKKRISEVQIGKIIPIETRKKMSKSQVRFPVICIETGKIFDSIMDASRATGINSGQISKILKGTITSSKGLKFMRIING